MKLAIHPPLLNSANPWCTTLEQLQELYDSPYTGAVTTRTATLEGFPNDESIHQFTFFNSGKHSAAPPNSQASAKHDQTGSLNTLGYSPLPLKAYLDFVKQISDGLANSTKTPSVSESKPDGLPRTGPKPFIISVTGTAEDVCECYRLITSQQKYVRMPLAMEINLSCPNIPNKPPPAYDFNSLHSYLSVLKKEISQIPDEKHHTFAESSIHVPIGIKTPPYTYSDQYKQMINALIASAKESEPKDLPCPVSFITATNTLGSSLLLAPSTETSDGTSYEVFHHVLNSATGTGIGGLAGAPLHPLALGNVYTIKGLLFQYPELEHIQIIGVGGVGDVDGYRRMKAVGAAAVGIGTALGRKGVGIFEEIGREIGG